MSDFKVSYMGPRPVVPEWEELARTERGDVTIAAEDLRWQPGEWPDALHVYDESGKLAEFKRAAPMPRGSGWVYRLRGAAIYVTTQRTA